MNCTADRVIAVTDPLMKYTLPTIPILFALFLSTACQPDLSANKTIAGEWEGINWVIQGEPNSLSPGQVKFTFTLPDTYTATNSGKTEKGVYRLDDDILYTTAEGLLQIKVRLERPDPDTLIMHMNRSGVEEVLTLVKR
jgi:hypothetical protein